MKNLNTFVSDAWVNQTDAVVEKWDALPSDKKKTFTADYLKRSLDAGQVGLDNAQEAITKINTLRDDGKNTMDGIEKIVADMRKANRPLSDAERAWVVKGKTTIAGMLTEWARVQAEFTANMPVIFRGPYWGNVLKKGAIDQKMVDQIIARRKQGIDISNDFGKQSPVVARMQEYAKRYPILAAELAQAEKDRTGKGHEGTGELVKKIAALEAGNKAWDDALTSNIGKLVNSISEYFKIAKIIIDKDKKGFGASLLKGVKLLVSDKEKAKDKAKASANQMNVAVKMKTWPAMIKAIKGDLKTRHMEHESLTAQLKNAGPQADPFRKMLTTIGATLGARQIDIDALAKQVDEALAAISK